MERKTRRFFLKRGALFTVAGCAPVVLRSPEGAAPTSVPMISLGSLRVSRIFLGSNPFFGFAHGNPQATGTQMRTWYTKERITKVLDEAARCGITAVWSPCYERWIALWKEYKDRGGALAHWIAQPDRLPMEGEIRKALKNGASAVCIQGCRIDDMVRQGKWDVIRTWLELVKAHELPAGMATHGARTHLIAEEKGMPADFYHQTLYRPDNYVPAGLRESLAAIGKLQKPVVAYKVLGAGRIRPQDTLPHVLRHLKRKDGICVGVFPKKNPREIEENVSLTRKLTARFS